LFLGRRRFGPTDYRKYPARFYAKHADNRQEKRLYLPEPFRKVWSKRSIASSSCIGDLHSRYRFTDARAAVDLGRNGTPPKNLRRCALTLGNSLENGRRQVEAFSRPM